ncbi:MAG: hypothetical protein M3198_09155 [Actinomycetota bacterium]|nr:hypothetical protein [Actinomycetota bacterium]
MAGRTRRSGGRAGAASRRPAGPRPAGPAIVLVPRRSVASSGFRVDFLEGAFFALSVVLLAGVFLGPAPAVGFLAVVLLGVVFFAGLFLVGAFLAAVFFAIAFLAGAFLAVVFFALFLAAAFFGAALRAAVFLVERAVFLTVFLAVFFGVFFAVVFFATVFFAAVFFELEEAVLLEPPRELEDRAAVFFAGLMGAGR